MAHDRFFDRDVLQDPFDFMADMRSTDPVKKVRDPAGRDIYVVTGLKLIEDVSRRSEDFSNRMLHLLMAGNAYPEVAELLASDPLAASLLLTNDAPDHKRYRSLVNSAFTTGRIANMAPMIEAMVDELIDDFIEDGRCNFVEQFAILLPTYIIADILGVPRAEYDRVRFWSDATLTLVGRMGTREEEIASAQIIVETRRYLLAMAQERRRVPRDDLISNLIHVGAGEFEPFNDQEVTALAYETSVAGNETTRNTLMSGMVQLLNRPDQLQALVDDPSLAANAVEEILRYETPASAMWRIAKHDTTLGDVDIPGGAEILLRFDAASRDPVRFADPDRFDIRRKNAHQHLAFGAASPHRCLGQMLARKELTIAFPKLLSRMKNLRIAEGSVTDYQPSLLFHNIGSLHLEFDPGPRLGITTRATNSLAA